MIKIIVDLETDGTSFNANIRGEVAKISRDLNEMILESIGTEATCITRNIFDSNDQRIGTATITNPWKE
jgi:hypothetical protein